MKLFFSILFVCLYNVLIAQETKLPLEMKGSHLFSQWKLDDTIDVKVFLETGFPRIVFSEKFAKEYLQGTTNMVEAPEDTFITLWNNDNQKIKVTYFINDSLIINGEKLKIDALVADVKNQKSWASRDMVFPLRDLKGKVELNIDEKYMKILDYTELLSTDFFEYDVMSDSRTRGLYMTTTMQIFDAFGEKEELKGNFLLDLGAAGAFFLNKNLSEVVEFVSLSDRMMLKDTTLFKQNPKTELSIIMPERIQVNNIEITGNFIAAMKIFASNASNNYVGIIGNSFFANFVIVFDFENNKFYIKPNSDRVKVIK